MFPKLSLSLKLLVSFGTLCVITAALSQAMRDTRPFRDRVSGFIDTHAGGETPGGRGDGDSPSLTLPYLSPDDGGLRYAPGDWERYITAPRRRLLTDGKDDGSFILEDEEDVDIRSYGAAKLNLNYGKSFFTKQKYRRYDQDEPVSRIIKSGYTPENETQLHMEGHVGRRLTLYIDHDSRKKDNQYLMQYRAVRDDEVIREINAGQIDIKMNRSKYAVYDDTTAKGMGIDTTVRMGKLTVKGFGSVTRGETVIENFRGNSSPGNVSLKEYQYTRNTYFQIEPFRRYDNLSASPADYRTTVAWTSSPADPASYRPYAVGVDASGFELYMDDQDPYNNYDAVQLSVDGGWYTRLANGRDYAINFSTGTVTFLRAVPENARLFAVYTLNGGSTASSDPAARVNVPEFSGKLFVFLKYGRSLHEDDNLNNNFDAGEDKNGDGKFNLDVYEIRSYYTLGSSQLLQDNLRIQFYGRSELLTRGEIDKLGKYSVDYSRGVVGFYLREPFKALLPPSLWRSLYTENQSPSLFEQSLYSVRVDYYREARSFQLKHMNIIPDSVRVKVDGRELSSSLFSVDHTSGFLMFTSPSNPLILPETAIEVRYEYLPFFTQTQAFIGGLRADYDLSRELKLGGTLLYTRSAGGEIIPNVGGEPTQTLVLEGDAALYLNRKRIADMVSVIPGVDVKQAPFELKGYAEYARSYKKINTFGKALIDDMESSEETVGISLFDKDWILSSLPQTIAQNQRGRLYYKYYRDPDNAGSLKGPGFSPYVIDYAVKPGPYNVATGHIDEALQSADNQRSLVFDFEFGGILNHAAAATRRLSSSAVDLSGLQYVEIIYRADGGAGSVDLFLELGKIDEDSDGDGVLDSEDANRNGFLDYDPGAGIDEDNGYYFNPSGGIATWIGTGPKLTSYTRGDGVLNSEDINGNGTLDRTESVVRIPGAVSTVANLPVTMADTTWQVKRIYIDRSSAAFSDGISVLKEVEALRLYLSNSGATTGRIYIDTIRFVSSRWRNIKINDSPDEDPSKFSVTMVNSLSDDDYRADAFIYSKSDIYKSLHGDRDDKELASEKETALQIDYNLANESGSVTRKFSKPMDIRFYKTVNLWMNVRSGSTMNAMRLRIGSSENDYIEYEFSKDYENLWREVKFNLQEGKGGGVERIATTGYPDLKRVTYMEFIVDCSTGAGSGRIWLNDIYTDSADTLVDDAYWYEAEFIGKKPLYRTKSGVPVISDIYIKYVEKGHGSQFSTLGKTTKDIAEHYRQLFSSVNILPNWSARLDIMAERSRTDSLNEEVSENSRGKSEKRSLYLESDYRSDLPGVPSVKMMYKNDRYGNVREEYIAGGRIDRKTDNRVHSPSLLINENLEDVLGGRLSASLAMDLSFRHERVERYSGDISPAALETYLPLRETEKRQKGDGRLTMNFQNRYFFIEPALVLGSQEIVALEGKSALGDTEILSDVRGDYHMPFVFDDSMRLVERNKKTGLRFGMKQLGMASPTAQLDLQYYENRFRDYTDTEKTLAGNYSRAKDARSYISSGFSVPLDFHKTSALKFIRGVNVSYTRSLLFQETEIPYEGEGRSAFDERYGISRSMDRISGGGMDFFRYPPWHFFQGRGNYANGRDYAYGLLNDRLFYPGGGTAQNYSNSLRLIDNYSLSGTLDFDRVVVNLGGGLNQVSERQTVEGVPGQVVTLSANSAVNFDLMRIFNFWFFRPNSPGRPYHSSSLGLGYDFRRNMLITSNIQEDTHSPSLSVTFKRDRTSLGLRSGLDYRRRSRVEYLSYDEGERDGRDDIYISNMAVQPPFREIDRGYRFSLLYETDVQWIYRLFNAYYRLVAFPIFSLEYSLLLNRYDYSHTVSPEPYDQHLVTGKLNLDLHKNVQGGLIARWALEKFRNRDTEGVNREIMSYEVGLNFTLVF